MLMSLLGRYGTRDLQRKKSPISENLYSSLLESFFFLVLAYIFWSALDQVLTSCSSFQSTRFDMTHNSSFVSSARSSSDANSQATGPIARSVNTLRSSSLSSNPCNRLIQYL